MAQTIKLKRSGTSGNIPTTSQLELGEVAINTYDGKMFIKKNVGGTESIVEISAAAADAILVEYQFTSTATQTTYSGSDDNSETLSYTPNAIQVFMNGILLDPGIDFTATNGTSIVLSEAADANDYLQIFAFKKKISNGQTTVDTFTGDNSTTAFTLSLDPGDENNTRVYIDGVYQSKGNYSVSGTTLTFSTAPPTSTAIEVEIGNRVVTLDTASNLDLPDNVKLRFGTSQDLQIYHDGSHSYINEQGTGNLYLNTTNGGGVFLTSAGENLALFNSNGAVNLYYDNSAKFATTSSGVTVTGTALADAFNVSSGGIGTGYQLNGSTVLNYSGGNVVVGDLGAGVLLEYNGSTKLATTSTGVTVTGTAAADAFTFDNYTLDNNRISTNQSGGYSGDIMLDAAGDIILDADSGAWRFKDNGGSTLEISTGSGTSPTFYSPVSDADIVFKGNDGGSVITALTLDMSDAGTANFNNNISLSDSKIANFGNSADGQIYHDGSHFRLRAATGNFNVQANDFHLTDASNVAVSFLVDHDGATSLRYNQVQKLATTSTGVDVTGTITADGLTIDGDSISFNTSAGDLDIQALGGGSNQIEGSGSIKIKAAGGSVDLINGTTEVLSTTATGINVTGTTVTDGLTTDGAITINGSGTEDRYLKFALDGRGSAFTGENAAFIFCGQGGSGDFLAGGLYLQSRSATAGREIGFITGTTPAKRMVIDSSGNVGIDPSSGYTLTDKLTVRGSQSQLRIQDSSVDAKGVSLLYSNSNNYGQLICDHRGNNQLNFYYSALNHYFGRNTSSSYIYMTLTDTGELGLGTMSPFATSHIKDTSWSSGAPYGTVQLIEGNDVNDNNWGHLVVTDTTTTSGNGGAISFATGTSSALNPFAGIKGVSEGTSYGGVGLFTRASGGTATERLLIKADGSANFNSDSTALMASFNSNHSNGGYLRWMNGGAAEFFIGTSGTVGGGTSDYYDIYAIAGLGQRFWTGALERMRITPAGNVGIRNTNPSSNLTIGSAQSDGLEFTYDGTNAYRNRIVNYWNSNTDTRMDFEIGRTGNVAPTTVLSVGYNSNVGIGLTNPSATLHVKRGAEGIIARIEGNTGRYLYTGTDALGHYIEQVGTTATTRKLRIQTSDGGSNYTQLFLDGANQRIYTDSTSKVGIGTTSPDQKLHVYGGDSGSSYSPDGADLFILENNDSSIIDIRTPAANSGGILFSDAGARGRGQLMYYHSSDTMAVFTAGAERMRILANGDVCLGNTVVNPASGFSTQKGFGSDYTTGAVEIAVTSSNATNLQLGRNLSDSTGDFVVFRKQGTVLGGIKLEGSDSIIIESSGSTGGGLRFHPSGPILPTRQGATIDNAIDLGSTTRRFKNIYTTDLHLSNENTNRGGNEIDGTEGNWTIQEGEEHLYIINNKSGKKYRFALEEIE